MSKLWLLKKRPDIDDGNNPWDVEYDVALGFVVRADSEAQARAYAHEKGGDETVDLIKPWLSSEYTTCVELSCEGKSGVILQNRFNG